NDFGFFAVYFDHARADAVVIITSNSGAGPKVMGLERKLFELIANPSQTQAKQTDLTKLSDTTAGQRLLAYVESFNSGDDNKVREFLNTHIAKSSLAERSVEDRLKRYREIYPNVRGFDLQGILEQSTTNIIALAKTKTGDTVNIILNLEPNEPHGIVSMMIELREGGDNGPGPGQVRRLNNPGENTVSNFDAKSSGTPEAIKQKLGALMTRVAANGFSGAILVAKDGQIIFNQAYGMADQAKGVANTTETLFDIGSIGKQFTAAAIMKLEMLGKLNTNDPINKYLDGVPQDKQAITIHQLLTMTSGIKSSLTMNIRKGEPSTLNDKEARLKELLNARLELPPGKGFKYSNGGYNLLAAIVEKASGQTYEQFAYENLFKPAGMKSTGFVNSSYKIPDWDKKTVAHVYSGETDNGIPNAPTWFVRGPGGIFTTTGDLYK
ncbi:MAG TPA: serine hydrolase domain-containing protein, partial [Blastocatellia bacterium]|nr:serine hydrolase domain-containing protein [Blastocatellia bacterium]